MTKNAPGYGNVGTNAQPKIGLGSKTAAGATSSPTRSGIKIDVNKSNNLQIGVKATTGPSAVNKSSITTTKAAPVSPRTQAFTKQLGAK